MEGRFVHWGAALLGLLAIVASGAWMLGGALLPAAGSDPVHVSPMAWLLASMVAYGFRPLAVVCAWAIAINVALAGALCLFLLVKRARDNRPARQLAMSLAMLSAGFALLLVISTLPPFTNWLFVTPLSSAGLFPLCAFAGSALLGGGLWTLLRFWRVYPAPVDRELLRTFLRERYLRRPRGVLIDHALERVRKLRGKTSTEEYSAEHLEKAERKSAQRVTSLLSERVTDSRLGRAMLALCAVTAITWWFAYLSPATVPGDSLIAIYGLCSLAFTIVLAANPCAQLVAFHYRFAPATGRRRVQWLYATGIFGNLLFEVWLIAQFVPLIALVALGEPFLLIYSGLELLPLVLLLALVPCMLMLALAASVFGRGFADPRLALGRATLWTLLGLVVTFVFVIAERAIALTIVRWLSLPEELGAVLAGAAVAVTFVPVRRAAERWVMRFVEQKLPTHLLAAGDPCVGAVAVVDITGFTRLSAIDEHAALLAATLLQKDVKRLVSKPGGRIVKFTGDGAMLTFEDTASAAAAVRDLHGAFAKGALALGLPTVALHSGIHWGEFVQARDGDIYGNTVNVAVRLAEAAAPNEVLVTQAFAEALGEVPDRPESIGSRLFKNLPAPIECFRLRLPIGGVEPASP